MRQAAEVAKSPHSERLDRELTVLATAQFDTPEFRLFFETPLTMARARCYALQLVFYNVNRRDCWAYVQAKAPWEVKRAIWQHESDELHFDPRGGSDHRTLMTKEAVALGMTEAEVGQAQPSPLVKSLLAGFSYINITQPWLGALAASHFLERRNNGRLIRGGGFSARWREKAVRELKLDPSLLISTNVHVDADMDHSDSIWDSICRYVVDDFSYRTALEGAQHCALADRAFRAGLAYEMRQL
jgi:Iron-containing redox enzyme